MPAFVEATRAFCANTTDPKAAGVPTFVAVMGAVNFVQFFSTAIAEGVV
jgi:hypothetical protein